ncbi:phytoene synthase [Rhodopseudomonas julia]|uniref:Phytoene synthase n=1 Tax=Rhodopseudomonas julia TaxID=200617 RepID=A0ABU0C965_9BRAD|nr:squalene/phytoene synthase family protein [Rhodopseudomonas julia]MDQ0327078.1 phytoene synthase [Rhodopseudomonas julia]
MAEPDPTLVEPVRERDLPRYYSVLFAPQNVREELFSLYAFAVEAEKVADVVQEATLGEIRLTWWRDSLDLAVAGQASGSPIVDRLALALRERGLSADALVALTEARHGDLYADPPATLADLEGRMGETQSSLFQLGGLFLGGEAGEIAEAAGHAGIAYGVAMSLWDGARARARGRLVIPSELLQTVGLSPQEAYSAEAKELVAPIGELVTFGRMHRSRAAAALRNVRGRARSAFLPLHAADVLLARIARDPTRFLVSPQPMPALSVLSRMVFAGFGMGR